MKPTTLEAIALGMSMVHLPPDTKPTAEQIAEGIREMRKNPMLLQAQRAFMLQLAEFVPDELGAPTRDWLHAVANETPSQD